MPVMLMKDGFEQIPADGLLYLLGLSAIYSCIVSTILKENLVLLD